ncbi:hypothetical protein [Castellaniella sp.]|uniref:hypothetical protein n=1 Tax=Castellaniella sp. TaxID=1955812 RepID=UPI003A94CC06
MDEIVGFVSQKTGLSADNARVATEAVLTFLKGKLPPALGSQLDQVLDGGEASSGLGDITKGLGGMFQK